MHAPVSPAKISTGLGWFAIVRIGLIQASIGALVMMATTVLNRLMVVEYGLLAAIPAGLVAWHYAIQLGRPLWGHGSDKGANRTRWIIGGMVVLAGGMLLATQATLMMGTPSAGVYALAILAYTIIGVGVGAAGTSALALLASSVTPERRAAGAAVTWIMMIAGIVASAFAVGAAIEPYTPQVLMRTAFGLAAAALVVTVLATYRLERGQLTFEETAKSGEAPDFGTAIREIIAEPAARRFTIFIFVSMMAYNMQDLILEPFGGQIFNMAPGATTKLGGMLNAGALVGMIVAGIAGSAFQARLPSDLRLWIITGCLGSAVGLAGLAMAAMVGPGWPLQANVLFLGFFNGLFTVAAIGAMMGLAGAGEKTREGVRMGVWGASQAIAFGFAGLLGAAGRDILLAILGDEGRAYQIVFAFEGALFVLAAILALGVTATRNQRALSVSIPSAPTQDQESFA